MYAGASGDFNPMHTDEVAAQEAGLPSVFGHGMFTAGLLATAVTNYVGIGNLKSYRVRFTKQTWPGEMLTHERSTVAREAPGQRGRARLFGRERSGEAKIQRRSGRGAAGEGDHGRIRGSTCRRPTSRRSRSGTGARRASSSSGTATRAATTTSTRGRSARRAGATTSSWKEASGRGTLYTYSVVHVNDLPPFHERVPYVAAIVELDEGPRVMTNIEGVPVRRAARRHAGRRRLQGDLRRRDDPGLPPRARAGAGYDSVAS